MSRAKIPTNDFAKAIKIARNRCGLSQEAFSLVSSRTYVSALERSLKSPTLSKVDELAAVLEIHPLTLLTLAYSTNQSKTGTDDLLREVTQQLRQLIEPIKSSI